MMSWSKMMQLRAPAACRPVPSLLARRYRGSGAAVVTSTCPNHALSATPNQIRDVHTTMINCDLVTAMRGPRTFNKLLRKQEQMLKKAKKQADHVKPKSVNFIESGKMKAFNDSIMEHLTLVMASYSDIIAIPNDDDDEEDSGAGHTSHIREIELLNQGFSLTKAKVTPTRSEIYIFYELTPAQSWSTRDVEELATILDKRANQIRRQVERLAMLGKLPRFTFVRDTSRGLPMPTPEELLRISNHLKEAAQEYSSSLSESEAVIDGLDTDSKGFTAASNNQPHPELHGFDSLRYAKPPTKTLRFDRDSTMDKIANSLKMTRGAISSKSSSRTGTNDCNNEVK